MPVQRILLTDGRPPVALVSQAAAAIAAGKCVVLPTETVYGFAVDPRQPSQVEAVRNLKGRQANQPFTHHLADSADLIEIVPNPGTRVMRLTEHYWPGPLTLILTAADGQSIGLRVPAQAFTQRVIKQVGHPLLLTSVNPSGDPSLTDPATIIDRFGSDIDLFCDAGPSPLAASSTVLRCTEPIFAVLREGAIPATELLREAARLILFVCTGNTCRSPLAQGYALAAAASKLSLQPSEVLARGLEFASAGTAAFHGAPASLGSLETARELGADLSAHSSQLLSRELVARAARIYCLSESHLAAVSNLLPGARAKAQLLDPGHPVPDPIGGDLDCYRQTGDHIARALDARMTEMLGLLQ